MNLKLSFIFLLYQFIICNCYEHRCGPNEYLNNCGKNCEASCSGENDESLCDLVCEEPACVCKVGYYRSIKGNCVTRDKCTKHTRKSCGPNEVLDNCGSNCESNCIDGDFVLCEKICAERACRCKTGYYRSMKGKCITREECTKSIPDLKECVQKLGNNATIMLDTEWEDTKYSYTSQYKKTCTRFSGCICKPDFYLSDQGICVGCELGFYLSEDGECIEYLC